MKTRLNGGVRGASLLVGGMFRHGTERRDALGSHKGHPICLCRGGSDVSRGSCLRSHEGAVFLVKEPGQLFLTKVSNGQPTRTLNSTRELTRTQAECCEVQYSHLEEEGD
ncbi:hypothetical protein VE00_08951 [Pseudogymnoascus sp. WSF 3629]|nr:hypothetical protein VE00_08951 [Pseudogymnoascus sp. WSF 3629]